jgi:hypothetical protein
METRLRRRGMGRGGRGEIVTVMLVLEEIRIWRRTGRRRARVGALVVVVGTEEIQ